MIKINLLPRKEFEIILDDKTVKGKYGTWSGKRFCDIKGLTLPELFEYLKRGSSFDDVCLQILCAVEYSCRKDGKPFSYTDIDVCEWIDEMGGIVSEDFKKLCLHASDEQEKKSLTDDQPSGGNTSEQLIQAG